MASKEPVKMIFTGSWFVHKIEDALNLFGRYGCISSVDVTL